MIPNKLLPKPIVQKSEPTSKGDAILKAIPSAVKTGTVSITTSTKTTTSSKGVPSKTPVSNTSRSNADKIAEGYRNRGYDAIVEQQSDGKYRVVLSPGTSGISPVEKAVPPITTITEEAEVKTEVPPSNIPISKITKSVYDTDIKIIEPYKTSVPSYVDTTKQPLVVTKQVQQGTATPKQLGATPVLPGQEPTSQQQAFMTRAENVSMTEGEAKQAELGVGSFAGRGAKQYYIGKSETGEPLYDTRTESSVLYGMPGRVSPEISGDISSNKSILQSNIEISKSNIEYLAGIDVVETKNRLVAAQTEWESILKMEPGERITLIEEGVETSYERDIAAQKYSEYISSLQTQLEDVTKLSEERSNLISYKKSLSDLLRIEYTIGRQKELGYIIEKDKDVYNIRSPSTHETFEYVYGKDRKDILLGAAGSSDLFGIKTFASAIQYGITGDETVKLDKQEELERSALDISKGRELGGNVFEAVIKSPAVLTGLMFLAMEFGTPIVLSGATKVASSGLKIAYGGGAKVTTALAKYSEGLTPLGSKIFGGAIKTGTEIKTAGAVAAKATGESLLKVGSTRLGQYAIVGQTYMALEAPHLAEVAIKTPERFGSELGGSLGGWIVAGAAIKEGMTNLYRPTPMPVKPRGLEAGVSRPYTAVERFMVKGKAYRPDTYDFRIPNVKSDVVTGTNELLGIKRETTIIQPRKPKIDTSYQTTLDIGKGTKKVVVVKEYEDIYSTDYFGYEDIYSKPSDSYIGRLRKELPEVSGDKSFSLAGKTEYGSMGEYGLPSEPMMKPKIEPHTIIKKETGDMLKSIKSKEKWGMFTEPKSPQAYETVADIQKAAQRRIKWGELKEPKTPDVFKTTEELNVTKEIQKAEQRRLKWGELTEPKRPYYKEVEFAIPTKEKIITGKGYQAEPTGKERIELSYYEKPETKISSGESKLTMEDVIGRNINPRDVKVNVQLSKKPIKYYKSTKEAGLPDTPLNIERETGQATVLEKPKLKTETTYKTKYEGAEYKGELETINRPLTEQEVKILSEAEEGAYVQRRDVFPAPRLGYATATKQDYKIRYDIKTDTAQKLERKEIEDLGLKLEGGQKEETKQKLGYMPGIKQLQKQEVSQVQVIKPAQKQIQRLRQEQVSEKALKIKPREIIKEEPLQIKKRIRRILIPDIKEDQPAFMKAKKRKRAITEVPKIKIGEKDKGLRADWLSVTQSHARFGKATQPVLTKRVWGEAAKTGFMRVPTAEMRVGGNKRNVFGNRKKGGRNVYI